MTSRTKSEISAETGDLFVCTFKLRTLHDLWLIEERWEKLAACVFTIRNQQEIKIIFKNQFLEKQFLNWSSKS